MAAFSTSFASSIAPAPCSNDAPIGSQCSCEPIANQLSRWQLLLGAGEGGRGAVKVTWCVSDSKSFTRACTGAGGGGAVEGGSQGHSCPANGHWPVRRLASCGGMRGLNGVESFEAPPRRLGRARQRPGNARSRPLDQLCMGRATVSSRSHMY